MPTIRREQEPTSAVWLLFVLEAQQREKGDIRQANL